MHYSKLHAGVKRDAACYCQASNRLAGQPHENKNKKTKTTRPGRTILNAILVVKNKFQIAIFDITFVCAETLNIEFGRNVQKREVRPPAKQDWGYSVINT